MLGGVPAEMDVPHVVHIHAAVLQESGEFDQRFGSALAGLLLFGSQSPILVVVA